MKRPTRYLPNGLEIWFVRGEHGFWPCHWKGWTALAVATVFAMGGILAVGLHLPPWRFYGFELLGLLSGPVLSTGVTLWWLSNRHSAPFDPAADPISPSSPEAPPPAPPSP